jgi:hypothetical protein
VKLKSLLTITLFVSLFGCAKHDEDEPSTPVLNFYKSATAGDSAGFVNSFTSTIRETPISPTDTAYTVKHQLEGWKGTHVEVKIREVKIDSLIPNMAKVYFMAKMTGKKNRTMDSVYLIVFKEEDGWKIGSMFPMKDKL